MGFKRQMSGEPADEFFRQLGQQICDWREDVKPTEVSDRVEAALYAWCEGNALCQSPIEQLFLAHLIFMNDGHSLVRFEDAPSSHDLSGWWGTTLEPQAAVGRLKVDFLLTCYADGCTERVIVECDGHDFHEKTKAQVRRDKERERVLVRDATVLRFSGSEIWHDPEKCAAEVGGLMSKKMTALMVRAGWIKG